MTASPQDDLELRRANGVRALAFTLISTMLVTTVWGLNATAVVSWFAGPLPEGEILAPLVLVVVSSFVASVVLGVFLFERRLVWPLGRKVPAARTQQSFLAIFVAIFATQIVMRLALERWPIGAWFYPEPSTSVWLGIPAAGAAVAVASLATAGLVWLVVASVVGQRASVPTRIQTTGAISGSAGEPN